MTLTIDRPRSLSKVLPIIALGAAMLLVAGFVYLTAVQTAAAAKPSDFGLTEGDTVSAAGSNDPDVYIVNELGYKRLFLNPVIFGFYGHLGGFAKVKTISAATRDAFPTSGLFRNCETNDQKVYGVETTGEDTGLFHWVNVTGEQAVVQDPNFFSKVFCINTNEANWYSLGSEYTSVSQVPSYVRGGASPAPTAGAVTVSLAPDNPAAQTVTLNAYGVTVMGLRFTGSGKVTELSFKRGGAGDTADYDNLYIYDGVRRLTGGRTPSSADGTVTFISIKDVEVSGTKDLQLVADYSATSGNVNNWKLTDGKLASGTISGFPLQSNNFTHAGANSGTINVDKSGSISNPKVGQKGAVLSEFKITANTEAALVKRIQIINGGTVKDADITNIKLDVQGTSVANGYMKDGYAIFDLGSGFKIAKGDNKIFKIVADVAGKKSETIAFYQENATDVLAIGDQFGYGMKPTVDTGFDASGDTGITLTLQGGVLTIAFNGPNATNIGTDTSDTILARYSFTAAADIEVKKLRLVLCEDTGGNGTYEAAADTDGGWPDLDDVKIVDEDNGQVVVGPSNGSTFTASEATGCPDSVTGAARTFTDTFDLKAGVTRNFKVTGDVKTANANGDGNPQVAGDIIRVVLDGYGEADLVTTAGDVSVMKYAGTNTAVDDSDIVPNTDLNGNNMTIQASSLTLGLAASPISTTYVKGTKSIDSIAFTFTAARASGLKVTDVKLSGYVRDTSGDTITLGQDANDSGTTVGGLISAVKLIDGETGVLISDSPSNNSLNTTTGTITFNNLAWQIPAGETKRLVVRTDLSSNATSGTSDQFSFDIAATTDVTAVDDSSKTVNAAASDPNPSNNTVVVTVNNSGAILVTAAAGTPIAGPRYWGQTDTEFSRFRVRTQNEAFYIEKLTIKTEDTAGDATNNIQNVKVKYTNEAGTTLTAVGSLDNNGSVSFGFTGTNRPYSPKDSSIDLQVLADMKTKAQGATSEVNFSLNFEGNATTDFRAVGAGSGTVIQGNDTTDDDTDRVTGNNHYVYRVFPEFILDTTLAASEPLATKDVLKFSIKAWGLSDSKILFDDQNVPASGRASGTASIGLQFEVVASGSVTTKDLTANLYDVDTGELVASATITAPQDDALLSNRSSLSFNETIGAWEKDVEITGGATKKFRVEVGFANFLDKSDYFQLILQDNEANLFEWVDGARTAENNSVQSITGVFRLLPMNGPIFVKQ